MGWGLAGNKAGEPERLRALQAACSLQNVEVTLLFLNLSGNTGGSSHETFLKQKHTRVFEQSKERLGLLHLQL